MKEYKTYNQQLSILRKRGLIVPKNGGPKRFLEQENYYNVINGYKDLFLQKDETGKFVEPEQYLPNAHFDELKSLFLFDRELRFLMLRYILIFENSFKTVISHEFSKQYPSANAYLDIVNYTNNDPKRVFRQISILMKTIHNRVDRSDSINHYIRDYGSVPFWVLVNYLTFGNLSNLYDILKDKDKNTIAKFYCDKYNKQHQSSSLNRLSSDDLSSALKIMNLVRNKCAHEERLYNSDFKNVKVVNIAKQLNVSNYDNRRIVVVIIYLKVLLDKKYFQQFHKELLSLIETYEGKFKTVSFNDILKMMGVDMADLEHLVQ